MQFYLYNVCLHYKRLLSLKQCVLGHRRQLRPVLRREQIAINHVLPFVRLGLWYLTSLSTIFQLYRGSQFYWWRKPLICYQISNNRNPDSIITHIIIYKYPIIFCKVERVNECCLTPTHQFFSGELFFNELIKRPTLNQTNTLCWIFIVLAQ